MEAGGKPKPLWCISSEASEDPGTAGAWPLTSGPRPAAAAARKGKAG